MARATAGDIGFQLGPRLNAAGRLADMSLSIECLLCDDPARALHLAQELNRLNGERRVIETDMKAQALEYLDRLPLDDCELPFGLCLFDPGWHQGVVGILAGRIRERVHRPVIAFAPDNHDGLLRGSARSVPGLHIRDVLAAVDVRQPDLIARFGGHAAAAGLSLLPAHLPASKRRSTPKCVVNCARKISTATCGAMANSMQRICRWIPPINYGTPVPGARAFPNRCSMAYSR
jgi:single-stranded-DNA-specific exonuclease